MFASHTAVYVGLFLAEKSWSHTLHAFSAGLFATSTMEAPSHCDDHGAMSHKLHRHLAAHLVPINRRLSRCRCPRFHTRPMQGRRISIFRCLWTGKQEANARPADDDHDADFWFQ